MVINAGDCEDTGGMVALLSSESKNRSLRYLGELCGARKNISGNNDNDYSGPPHKRSILLVLYRLIIICSASYRAHEWHTRVLFIFIFLGFGLIIQWTARSSPYFYSCSKHITYHNINYYHYDDLILTFFYAVVFNFYSESYLQGFNPPHPPQSLRRLGERLVYFIFLFVFNIFFIFGDSSHPSQMSLLTVLFFILRNGSGR